MPVLLISESGGAWLQTTPSDRSAFQVCVLRSKRDRGYLPMLPRGNHLAFHGRNSR